MNPKRIAKHMIRIIRKMEKYGIEVKSEFFINESGQAENFIARSTADKRVGF